MIDRIIDWCIRNRFLVFIAVAGVVVAGVGAMNNLPLNALPDISDVQVIVHTAWMGQPPDIIEDQVTYPIVTTMLAAPHVKTVRAQTMPNDSYVYVVFEDGTDLYWARTRVLEYLQQLQGGSLPPGVSPMIGPDATGAGWIFHYALIDKSHRQSLADLRALQDWKIRYALETVPGVAEIAAIGGFVRQYQVKLDPNRLLALKVSLPTVIEKIRDSNSEVGGRVLEMSGADYQVRGLGYIHSLSDIEQIAVGANNGTPILIRDLGVVSFGPDIREGVADWNGEGETVGGIVVMRDNENALRVITALKAKIAEVQKTLPEGVQIVTALRSRAADIRVNRYLAPRPDRGGDRRQPRHHNFPAALPLRAGADSYYPAGAARVVHPDVLPARQLEHHVAGRIRARDRCAGRCVDRDGGERPSSSERGHETRSGSSTSRIASGF